MKFLIIDKRQRVELKSEYSFVLTRLLEEIKALGYEGEVCYFEDIQMQFNETGTKILVNEKDIREFSHIIPRGHSLDRPIQYETKRIIADYIDQHNNTNPGNKIKMQNSQAIKSLPYYSKLYMSAICSQNKIPLIDTYYGINAGNSVKQLPFAPPYIVKNYLGQVELRMIEGKEKLKKNVFKIENDNEWQQENLTNKDLSEYLVQEFIPTGEDVRVFVKLGKALAAFKRVATEGFMTVIRGKYTIFDLSQNIETLQLAEKVAQLFQADFMAVDFMYKNGKPLVQEISFSPGFKAFEIKIEGNQMNMAKEIVTAF